MNQVLPQRLPELKSFRGDLKSYYLQYARMSGSDQVPEVTYYTDLANKEDVFDVSFKV